ncbi:MAG: oxidoreductase [Pseudomonadales bacterium]
MNTPKETWLITGCSTGIGRELALEVLGRGAQVAVTARNISAIADIVESYPDTAVAVALDVCEQSDIEAAFAATLERFGGIDVLVNNAGYGYLSAIEEGDSEQLRTMFETNFFGLLAMTQKVIPFMRERRSGCILNISSQAGLMGNPGTGFYSSSKYAVEGLTEALSKEVAPFGIKVCSIQPGPFRTDWAGRSMQSNSSVVSDYDEHVSSRINMIGEIDGRQPGDPKRAAGVIADVAAMENPPAQLLLGSVVLDTYKQKLVDLSEQIDRYESITRSADYPPEEL